MSQQPTVVSVGPRVDTNLARILVSVLILTIVFLFSAESRASFSSRTDTDVNQGTNALVRQPSPQQLVNLLNDQLLLVKR